MLKTHESRTIQDTWVYSAPQVLWTNTISPASVDLNKPSDSLRSFVSKLLMDRLRKRSNQQKNPEIIANISRSTPMHDLVRPMQGTYPSTVSCTIWHMAIRSCTPYAMLLQHLSLFIQVCNLAENAKFLPKPNCV